jgi:threonine dehydrogenase-like Zn-dependent dehydrogenase
MKTRTDDSILVFGLGPAGLVTGVCAKKDRQVIVVDPDLDGLENVRRAEPRFFEPRLKEHLAWTIASGTFSAAALWSSIGFAWEIHVSERSS